VALAPAGAVRGRPNVRAAAPRAQDLSPVLEVSPGRTQLDDLGLALPRVDPVGRKEEKDPGLALVGRKPPALGGHDDGEPHHSHVRHDAQESAFSGAQEAPVRFQQRDTHCRGRRATGYAADHIYDEVGVPAK
jgi:hypothetical protein